MLTSQEMYEQLTEARDYLLNRIDRKPQIAIILGSCLGDLADQISDPTVVPYREVPHMLTSTAPGHKGEYVFGKLSGKDVVAMSGRFHYYEGYEPQDLAMPIRLLKLLGVEVLILTNAAGCVNTAWQQGDVMVIEDQINLQGLSPMRGPNLDAMGERFFDVCHMYPEELQELALETADELGQGERTHRGIYYFMPGPQYETPAEIRAIRILGGDAVGMSTVKEALTAAHAGLPVLGLSFLTNMAAGITDVSLSTEEVNRSAQENMPQLQELVLAIIKKL